MSDMFQDFSHQTTTNDSFIIMWQQLKIIRIIHLYIGDVLVGAFILDMYIGSYVRLLIFLFLLI